MVDLLPPSRQGVFALDKVQYIGAVLHWSKQGNTLSFLTGSGAVQMTALAPDLIRVRFLRPGQREADWELINLDWPEISIQVQETGEEVTVFTGELTVRVGLSPLRLSFYDEQNRLIGRDHPQGGIFWRGSRVGCWKEMPGDEHYYGLGEKTGFLDRRGRRWVMWNTDNLPHLPTTDPLYQSIPFLLALRQGRAYGIFFHNTWRSYFDLGKDASDRYGFYADGGELDYFFIYGPDPKKVLFRYGQLTGRAPLPPRWALGYQQSRYSYYPATRVLEVARRFRERDIPADVIYLDIHYMNQFRVFTWDPQGFPAPKRLLNELAEMGFKVVTIVDPGVKKDEGYWVYAEGISGDYFCRYPNGEPYVGEVWPGPALFPDFSQARVRRWWGELHRELLEAGVAGIWNDMNEPSVFNVAGKTMDLTVIHGEEGRERTHAEVHNLYGFLMTRATYEGLLRLRPGERPFVLTRSGFAGIQRYAAVWTGDNSSWWEHLAMAMPMLLNLGLSGVPLVGSDIGGFMEDGHGELFARWIQLGAFCPFMRTHSAIDTVAQEPWSFGPEVEEIARRYIKLRYRFLPYWYSLFWEAYRAGLPPMRPLLWEYPADPVTWGLDDEFLVGKDLLVAPVYRPAIDQRQVYLPAGTWINYWTEERYAGGRYYSVAAPLDVLPLFVRAGAILPLGAGSSPMTAGSNSSGNGHQGLILHFYPDPEVKESTFLLYEDDGHSLSYQEGHFLETRLRLSWAEDGIRISLEKAGNYNPGRTFWQLEVHGLDREPAAVLVGPGRGDGEKEATVEWPVASAEISSAPGQRAAGHRPCRRSPVPLDGEDDAGWFYDRKLARLFLRVPDQDRAQEIWLQLTAE